MKLIRQKFKCAYHVKDVMFANNWKKIAIKLGIYIIILFVTLLIGILPNIEKKVIRHHARFATDLKYILMWKNSKKNMKNFINRDAKYRKGQTEFIQQNCSFINCYITYNKKFINHEEFDAVVFNVHDIIKLNPENLTIPRSSNQMFIFKSFETAERHIFCKPYFENFFNWTWTYKLNSDIPHPLFNIFNNKGTVIGPKINMTWKYNVRDKKEIKSEVGRKTKAVAIYMNNCKLKTKHVNFLKKFTQELQGYNLTIDIYGRCGTNECGRNFNNTGCDKIIDEQYYFLLVLEDSFSPDFVTEKVARAMKRYAIPIIVGGSNYSSFLPPGSYINAKAFPVKDIASILDYLIKDKEKYSYFHEWRGYYDYEVARKDSVCDLCKKLNENSEQSSYKEFRKWWNSDYEAVCEKLKIKKIFHLDY